MQTNLRMNRLSGLELLADCMSTLYNDSRTSDVILKVGPHLYHAHRLILSAWSDVFLSLTDPRWTQSSGTGNEPQVHTLCETEECENYFNDFLQFMYTGKVELYKENVYAILTLADKYLVHGLGDICEDYVLLLLESSEEPWQDAIKATKEALSRSTVQEKSFRMLEDNFRCWYGDGDMNEELLVKLLQSSNLVDADEFLVFDSVVSWLKTDDCRLQGNNAEQILSLIRYEHIPSSEEEQLLIDCPTALKRKLKELISASEASKASPPEPRIYMEPTFCVQITNKDYVEGDLGFTYKTLRLLKGRGLLKDDNIRSLKCPVARKSEGQCMYSINDEVWYIGCVTIKSDSVRYVVRPHSGDIGKSYRMAILIHDIRSEEDDELMYYTDPIICVKRGHVSERLTVDVSLSSTLLDCDCDLICYSTIEVAIFVSDHQV